MVKEKRTLQKKIEELEKQLAEEKQKNSYATAILESGNLIIWSVDKEFKLLSFNQNYFTFFLPSESKSKVYFEKNNQLKSVNAHKFWTKKYQQALAGQSVNFEIRIEVDGQYEWKEVFLNPVYGNDANINAISGIAYDVTDKTQARKKLINSEEKFRNIFESFQDLYFRTDFKGNITMLSPSVKDIIGFSEAQLKGKNITNYYIYNIKIKSLLRDLIKYGSVRNFEAGLVNKSGNVIPCICNIRIITSNGVPKYIEGVARDITELKRTNLQLQHSKELAERSLKIKERFLANMSHEIKTPLNGIMGMLHLLDDEALNDQQKKHLESLKSSSEILMSMLNDMLDIAKIEAGKMELKNSVVSPSTLFEKLSILYEQEAKRNKLKLHFEIDEAIPKNILADEIKLIQIFSNLISNAIKFTPANGDIHVRAFIEKKKRNGALLIMGTVKDTGIGILDEDTKKLFKSFTQLDSSTSKIYKGTGLGLFISKKLTELMKGEIGVKPNENGGSTFWFTFETLEVSPLPEIEMSDNASVLLGNPSILVVDDNKVNLHLASELLKKAGCKVTTANSGKKAVRLASKTQFELILMDIQMPTMDGIEATVQIKNDGQNMGTPTIAMTAYSMSGDKDKYLQAGFDDYLSKPIIPDALIMMIKKWTEDDVVIEPIKSEPTKLEYVTLNNKTLGNLSKYGGKEVVSEALAEFDSECDQQLQILRSTKNIEEILNILHTLKGNAGTLGVEKMAFWAEMMEDEVKTKKYHNFDSNLKELEVLHTEFKSSLKQF
ncbi:MAG TPA: response regulator [Fulvivirga sp.]|nr:response regulator [Fulvivirga sp.]